MVRGLKAAHAFEQLGMAHHRPSDVGAADARPGFDLPNRFGLHPIAMLGQERAVDDPAHPRPHRQEDLVGIGQIGNGVFDDATELLEGRSLGLEDRPDPPIERQAAKIETPGDANAGKVPIERLEKPRGIGGIAARIAGIGPRHDAQQQRDVRHRSRQRAFHRETR